MHHKRERIALCWVAASILAISYGIGSFAHGADEPGNRLPDRLLAARPENQPLVEEAQTLFDVLSQSIPELAAKDLAALKKIKPEIVGDAAVQCDALERIATRLIRRAEPAGVELQLRKQSLRADLQPVITQMIGLRAGEIQRSFTALQSISKDQQQNLPKARTLAMQGKWDEAAEVLFKAVDEVERYAVFYEGKPRQEVLDPFGDAIKAIHDHDVEAARQEIATAAAESLAAMKKSAEDWNAIAQSATASVRENGAATVGDESLSGPKTVARLLRLWDQHFELVLQARAWQWAAGRDNPDSAQARAAFVAEYESWAKLATQQLVAIIEADAARITPQDVPAVYSSYIQETTPILALRTDPEISAAIDAALDGLAKKLAAFGGQIAAYKSISGDMLRWMQKSAQSAVEGQRADYQLLPVKFFEAGQGKGTMTLFPPEAQSSAQAMIRGPLPPVVKDLSTKLVGQKVRVQYPLPRDDLLQEATILDRRTRATMPGLAQVVANQVNRLQNDLQVSPSKPALSLQVSLAVYRARQAIFSEVGGELISFRLQGLLPYHLSPRDARQPVGVAPLSAEPHDLDVMKALLLSGQIQPRWIRHEYFFLSIP